MAKKSSQKSQKLSKYQIEFINKNYTKIKELIAKYNRKKFVLLDEACSFIPDACLEYKNTLKSEDEICKSIAKLCILRQIDNYRSVYSKNQARHKKIGEIKESLMKDKGWASEEELVQIAKEEGIDYNYYATTTKDRYFLDQIKRLSCRASPSDPIEWNDLKEKIISASEEYFSNNNKYDLACKKLITDYIIPIAESKQNKNLDQLKNELNIGKSKISTLKQSPRMRIFMRKFLNV